MHINAYLYQYLIALDPGVYILPDSHHRVWGSFSKCKFSGKLFKRRKGKRRRKKEKGKEREERKRKREVKREKGKKEGKNLSKRNIIPGKLFKA